jgi:hypothetical protein
VKGKSYLFQIEKDIILLDGIFVTMINLKVYLNSILVKQKVQNVLAEVNFAPRYF